jgi:hypothetical protein
LWPLSDLALQQFLLFALAEGVRVGPLPQAFNMDTPEAEVVVALVMQMVFLSLLATHTQLLLGLAA